MYTSLDTVEQYRTIYGVFDFLGDVGGLLDLFRLAAELLLKLIAGVFGSNLNLFLIHKLFRSDPKSKTA